MVISAEAIVAAFGASPELTADRAAALAEDVRAAAAAGRDAWPALDVDETAFAAWLGARAGSWDEVPTLDAAALYLTCAVAHDVPGAVAAFRDAHAGDVDLALRRGGLAADAMDDARQLVWTKLLAPGSEKLRQYVGRGALSHWVRAVAVRQAISLARKRGPMERVVAEPSDADADVATDPELAFLKAYYRDRFKAAFSAVLDELAAPDRTLLRLRFVEGLTLDQLARVRDVHRATIARHLARLRKSLLEDVRARLSEDAGLASDTELQSVLRLVESNLELSLPRILGDGTG